jgi:predicted nucleic acid-binding protein
MQRTGSLPMRVIDASVIAKWYLRDEESAEDALALRSAFNEKRFSIVMPDIARYEVANALHVARRRKRISEEEAQLALADALTWDFTYVGTNDLILAAYDVAHRLNCALYDALYLALAEMLGCEFVTADRLFFDRTHSSAASVTLLGNATF